jgi:hypothetical protein
LTVSRPGDASEKQADAAADKVMRMTDDELPASKHNLSQPLQQSITPVVQTKSESGNSVGSELSGKIASSQGGGNRLDANTQSFMQNRFGTDFSGVRVHTDTEAVKMNRELNAKAFTVGKDIYFNDGQYQPETRSGKHLLAHELAHTIQQGQMPYGKQIQRDEEDEIGGMSENVEQTETMTMDETEHTEDLGDAEEPLQQRGSCAGSSTRNFLTHNFRNFEITVPRGCRATLRFDSMWVPISLGADMCCTGADNFEVVDNNSRTHTLPAAPNICGDEKPTPARGSFTVGGGRHVFRINVDRQRCEDISLQTDILITIR